MCLIYVLLSNDEQTKTIFTNFQVSKLELVFIPTSGTYFTFIFNLIYYIVIVVQLLLTHKDTRINTQSEIKKY